LDRGGSFFLYECYAVAMAHPDHFTDIIGHRGVKQVLTRAIVSPHHAYLIVGGEGLGAHAIAERFVRALAGMSRDQPLLAHPDVAVLAREAGDESKGPKTQIAVEAVRALRERISRRPVVSQRSVAYIPEADRLNDAGANALLKSMEEPPAGAVFVLVARDESRLPATIKSRVALFRLTPVASPDIIAWLAEKGIGASERTEAVRLAAGYPGRALRYVEDADLRARIAEAGRIIDRLLSSTSAGEALAALDADARRAEASDDPQLAWQTVLDTLMQALRERMEEPASRVLGLGHALAAALRVSGLR
jgi:DNA polymerase-3 subunit delta'